MKRSIFLLFLAALTGCSKNTGSSKFAGTWSGSYSSKMIVTIPIPTDTGTVQIVVDAHDSATATLQSLVGGTPVIMTGKVDASSGAIFLAKYGKGDYGLTAVFLEGINGNLSGDSGSGTLNFPWATVSSWRATKK